MDIAFKPVSRTLPRAELASFLPNDRAMRAFEDLQIDLVETAPGAFAAVAARLDELAAAPVVLWQASDVFRDGRLISPGVGITLNLTSTQMLISI